jgi:hypothetical protein
MLVQVTRVLALMFSEVGLNGPPPPAMVMLVLAIGLQPGDGLGLTDGLGLGVTPVTAPCVACVLMLSRIAPAVTITHFIKGSVPTRCAARVDIFLFLDGVMFVSMLVPSI